MVIEPWEPMRKRLKVMLPGLGFPSFEIKTELTDDVMEGAVGIVFAGIIGSAFGFLAAGVGLASSICRVPIFAP